MASKSNDATENTGIFGGINTATGKMVKDAGDAMNSTSTSVMESGFVKGFNSGTQQIGKGVTDAYDATTTSVQEKGLFGAIGSATQDAVKQAQTTSASIYENATKPKEGTK